MPDPLLSPRSIVVVGASRHPTKLGSVIARNILEGGFRGRVELVNPSGGRLLGRRMYRSVVELRRRVDLAILAVPAHAVTEVVRDLGRKGIPAAIVIAAGFGESGPSGLAREDELRSVASSAQVKILGPNCLGIVNPKRRLNASFGGPMPKSGGVAVVSQSGAMAVAMSDWARARNLGVSTLISLGNEVDRDAAWAVARVGADRTTTTVLLYLENLRNPRAFIAAARRAARRVRLFAVLAGSTNAGATAAISHTGRLATSAALTAAALRDAGVVVTDSLETLFRSGELADRYPGKDPRRVGIVTNAGGAGILAADAVAKSSLELAKFLPATGRLLRPLLPEELSVHNPLDLRGDAPPARYRAAVHALTHDAGVDAVLALGTPQVVTHPTAAAGAIAAGVRGSRKVVTASWLGGQQVAVARERLARAGIPNAAYPEHAVAALDALHRSFLLARGLAPSLPKLPVAARPLLGSTLLGLPAQRALSRFGVRFARSFFLPRGVGRIPKVSLPAVAKAIHPNLIHKTESHAVLTNLTTPAMVGAAVRRLRKLLPDGKGGILIQEQREGIEVHIGGLWHPKLGPVLAFGTGGIGVEQAADTVFVVLPTTRAAIAHLLQSHPVYQQLTKPRGRRGSASALVRTLFQVADFLVHHPEVLELDLNPVMVDARSAVGVDARILLKQKA